MEFLEEKFQRIINSNSLLIFGAKVIAIEVIEGFRTIAPSVHIVGCAVSNLHGNETQLMGLPVKTIDDYQLDIKNTCVLIALGEKYHEVVRKILLERGYQKIYEVDSIMRNLLFKRVLQKKMKRLLEN